MPRQQHFRRLAGEQAERRHVTDSVAGEKRCKRARQREPDGWRQAPPPAFRTDDKPETRESENEKEAPADALDTIDDLGRAGPADCVGEERCACER